MGIVFQLPGNNTQKLINFRVSLPGGKILLKNILNFNLKTALEPLNVKIYTKKLWLIGTCLDL